MSETREDHGLENALAWFQSIKEMVEAYEFALERPASPDELDEAQQYIQESVLSVEVRDGWHSPGGNDPTPTEYRILLTTGGPALQLTGELDEHGEPESARLEHQDWGTPWTRVPLLELAKSIEGEITEVEAWNKVEEILFTFASQFYFGEG